MKSLILYILIFSSFQIFGQTKVLIKFGDEALFEGDNYGASKFYLKAWNEDSTYEGLIYKLGLAFKGYHNYKKSLKFFKRIEASQDLQINHPDYLFHIAELYKGLGDYKNANNYFEKYSRINRDTKSFKYLKSKNEIKNHKRVLALNSDIVNVAVKNIGKQINTVLSEYYPVWLNDSSILYSTLRATEVTKEGVIKDETYSIQIFKGTKRDSVWHEAGFVFAKELKGISFTDGSFDVNGDFYFSKQRENLNYQLVKSRLILKASVSINGDSIYNLNMDTVFDVKFSEEDASFNFRNPFVFTSKGKKYILFSSNRLGGRGKMDLWYSELKKGVWTAPKNLGPKVNTPGDEIGPNYNLNTDKFYFASDWHYGLGGLDLFEAIGLWKRPTSVLNLGIPFNSSSNDLYISPLDSIKGLFTSSRTGSQTYKDAACCNDLYTYNYPVIDSTLNKIVEVLSRDSIIKKLQRLVKEFHVTLYFHNDRPNPNNWDTITPYNYMDTYESYLDSIPTYHVQNTFKKNGKDSLAALKKINGFFDDYVHKGVSDLKLFCKELLQELESGSRILLTVKGYASPLAKSNYNVNLTLRRINTLQNYLRNYPEDKFSEYLDETAENGGLLRIKKIPFGEFRSDTLVSDNYHNTKLSVYSMEASLERKIEIINLTLIEDLAFKESYPINLDSSRVIYDLGVLDTTVFNWRFELQNNTDRIMKIINVDPGCHCINSQRNSFKLSPNEYENLDLNFDLSEYSGKVGRRIVLAMEDGTLKELILLMEISK